jgi:hypothetical protein
LIARHANTVQRLAQVDAILDASNAEHSMQLKASTDALEPALRALWQLYDTQPSTRNDARPTSQTLCTDTNGGCCTACHAYRTAESATTTEVLAVAETLVPNLIALLHDRLSRWQPALPPNEELNLLSPIMGILVSMY